MGKKTLLLVCVFVLACSCDLLKSSPYEVEAWTPGEGFQSEPGKIKVSVLLSHESDRIKTEQAFSLAEDGRNLKGDFLWEGSRLVFAPASPLEPDRDYFVSLETGAQDRDGLSLENKFEASFTTRRPGGKPRIVGADPEHEGALSESRGEFGLFFSEPVRLDSCQDYISFNPAIPGSWRLEDGGKTARFIPREPWQAGGLYRVKVESGFAARSGMALGADFITHFRAGRDNEKPLLRNAFALHPGGTWEEIPLEKTSPAEYSGWETSTRLCLVFSEPVYLDNLKDLLSADPGALIAMESPRDVPAGLAAAEGLSAETLSPEMAKAAVFRIAGPGWGDSLLFRLGPGVKDGAGNESREEYAFRIKIAGPLSKPPALVGIRLPMAPGNGGDQKAVSFGLSDVFAPLPIEYGEYPSAKQIPAWVELYFVRAADTEIDTFSAMDLFRVESTNQAFSFSPRSVRSEAFTMAEPREGWEKLQRIEIRGLAVNTVNSGLVTFRVSPGLRDKRGNRSADDFRISLLK